MKKILLSITLVLALLSMCILAVGCSSDDVTPSIETTGAWSATDEYSIRFENGKFVTSKDYIVCIEKKHDEDFVILNLTDIQLGAVEANLETGNAIRAKKTLKKLIDAVHPDLITLTGDQSYGAEDAIFYVGNLIDAFGIPWAPVYGNHDNECEDVSTAQQAYIYENNFVNCIFKAGPSNLATVENGNVAYGNYIINIVEQDDSENGFSVIKSLFMMNSRNYLDYDKEDYAGERPINDKNYAKLSDTQVDWYKWALTNVQSYGRNNQVRSAMFLHIPIYAYNTAFKSAYKSTTEIYDYKDYYDEIYTDNVLDSYTDKSRWNEGYEDSVGECREGIYSSPYDDHVFEKMLDFDDNPSTDFVSTDLIVAGHDHVNNFIVNYQGTDFVYGLKTGSGCYYDEDLSGGTAIILHSDGTTIPYHEYVQVYAPLLPYWLIVLIVLFCIGIAVLVFFLVRKKLKKKKSA